MKQLHSVLFLVFVSLSVSAQHSKARYGQLDLRNWDFRDRGNVALEGEWEFYMSQLLSPKNFSDSIPKDFVIFPDTWNDVSKGLKPGNGFATYRLKVLLPSAEKLSLELPHFYSNYQLWINGKKVAENGNVGNTPETSFPEWRPQTVAIPLADTLDIVIQISNFHHAKGGIRENILIGLSDNLATKRAISMNMNIIVVSALIVIASVFILLFLFFKSEKAALYFAALAITWAIRSCFSNLYLINSNFPQLLSWEASVKIEYLTLYGTMVWALLFLHAQFKQDVSSVFKYVFVSCNLLFCVFTIVTSATLYTQFLPVYLSFALLLLLYILYVVIHAVIYERPGVWLIVTAIVFGVIIFGYDLGSYQGLSDYNSILINAGYLLIFLLLGFSMSMQLGFFKRSSARRDVLTYDDLYGTRK
ncbi:MAG TPA: 7TM diverse intracellular signaling domain-containing protein [Chryseosolibacter sp.]|nr:7TM diverse intracellular signaling domain-containing protein [Chryseosolibacter sp.]